MEQNNRDREPLPPGLVTNTGYNQLISPGRGSMGQWQSSQRQRQSPQRQRQSTLNPRRNFGARCSRNEVVARAEQAATAAYNQALSTGESVGVWKVTQSMMGMLKINSMESLGLSIQEIPCLFNLMRLEGRLNAFIHCHAAVRMITTLYDLSVEICRHEGVEDFSRLGLGPLAQHPLVVHYFTVGADIVAPFKISTEQIIAYLYDYIRTCNERDIQVENFLSFVAAKESVSSPKQLSIRIQSIRMHVGFLRRIERVEKDLTKKVEAAMQRNKEYEREKRASELHLKIIADRINFSNAISECGPKHIRFLTDSSSDDDEVLYSEKSRKPHAKKRRIDHNYHKSSGSCPYPSAAEERARLKIPVSTEKSVSVTSDGDKDVGVMKSKNTSKRKREAFHSERPIASQQSLSTLEEHELYINKHKKVYSKDVQLTDSELRIFIVAWRNICSKKSVFEVLKTMPELQGNNKGWTVGKMQQNIRRLSRVFTMQPARGLLNVAVMSMKMGLWDTFLDLNKQESLMTADPYDGSQALVQLFEEESAIPLPVNGLTTQNVLEQVMKFFDVDSIKNFQGGELAKEEWFMILKKVWDCEKWLMNQLSVQEFACLGFGHFLDFLEKHLSQLPQKIRKLFTVHKQTDLPLVACISRSQLLDFFSQAVSDLGDDKMLTKKEISVLLHKQFPLISFEQLDSHSVEEILDYIKKSQRHSQQKKAWYSSALLARISINEQSTLRSHCNEQASKYVQTAGVIGNMTSTDALKCLLKAPMLSDLEEWSHWDQIFAPTLGPMLNWMDKEVSGNTLVCLVTKSGKLLRLDVSATLDEFLESAVKGCAKQTAIQFVSIVSLYGGTHHAPIALMKSHACWALDVLVKNFVELFEHEGRLDVCNPDYCINCWRTWLKTKNLRSDFGHGAALEKAHVSVEMAHNNFVEKSHNIEKTTQANRAAARFILDCLFYLPPEFRVIAANIFLSALAKLSANASKIILDECDVYDERSMLHEIGFSIGILEWIKDYQAFSLNASDADISVQERQEVQNNVEHIAQCKSNLDLLDGVRCSDSNSIDKNEKMLSKLHLVNLNDGVILQSKAKERAFPISNGSSSSGLIQIPDSTQDEDAKKIIESIRREEFGLDLVLEYSETDLLKKQHARLGRALHCLSQELYSEDSHFLLELVQNADDNLYPADTEPTLAFVLESNRVVVLNNELGFTAKDIKALCDVGNSTKKGSSAGYIGHKGIGFKSVFRVTDAPEIHSNGFHVKFDITEGELGFILPTLVAPLCDPESFSKDTFSGSDKLDHFVWNTCIVLPLKASFLEGTGVRSWVSIFADLHPSLLLFLHRLRCIIVRDSLTNSLKIMQRKDIGNGLVNVSHGKESTTWLVASKKLNAGALRPGIQATEISMAFTLREDRSGEYEPVLEQQPVFAFLPLRAYGLKFILQGDFILPCSREEVDGDSAWNQWLLSEIPELFVRAEDTFRYLPCYQSNPGTAVTLYMSFVPLVGEVLGFFSPLPGMVLSKLRASPCLPLEGMDKTWVLPCKVLRGWSNQIRVLLPDDLLNSHLGLGYLDRDVKLSDTLATALGVPAYGPGILIEIMKSLCNKKDALRELGLNWLGSWLVALHGCLKFQPTGPGPYFDVKQESDFLSELREIPFIPLSDGSYSSLTEGSIWLPFEALEVGIDAHILRSFPKLHSELRIVHSSILSAPSTTGDVIFRNDSDGIVSMLQCVGIGQLSTHEVVKTHILPAMSTEECMTKDKLSLIEYLAFIMLHLQSNCSFCYLERTELISELQKKAVIVTNNGYKRAGSEPLHFSREFGNPIDMKKILTGTNVTWNEIDRVYLDFFSNEVQPLNLSQWRVFFKELGVTDFVQVLNVERKVKEQSSSIWKDLAWDGVASTEGWTVNDWESPELVDILTNLSNSSRNVEQCSCLLEILDNVWDGIYGAKQAIYWPGSPDEKKGKCTEPSFILHIRGHRWVQSRFDGNLCFPTDLFFDCDDVKSILGSCAPYATPQVHNRKLVADIGFRTQVFVKDALDLLYKWSHSECKLKSSTSQMAKLYSFVWTRMDTCREEVAIHFQTNPSIFLPVVDEANPHVVTEGIFLSLDQVYWRDPTGCLDLLMKGAPSCATTPFTDMAFLRTLCDIYPNLHNFFTNGCYVQESPDFDGYIRIVQNLSRVALPSQAYTEAVQVLLKWAEDVESGRVDSKEISRWKDCLHNLDCSVLPTIQDKWVSLHQNVGLVCWCDDVELGKQFRHCNGVYFVCLHAEGKFSKIKGKNNVPRKIIMLMHTLGIPSLSEVVVREAICYGLQDSKQVSSLINWILPYAQRYMYKMHPEIYCSLQGGTFSKQSDFLCLLVVEKLFYSHNLKGYHTLSNKRHECSCLLEGNTLYVSREAEYSTIYLELSRLFFKGYVNLQLTNFLHLITIIAESGSTEEQTESFITNSQTIPKLPQEEPTWFCEFRDQSDKPVTPLSPSISQSCLTIKKLQKCCVDTSWPPTTWFGAQKSRNEAQTHASISGINQDDERNDQTIAIENVSNLQFSTNSACESDEIVDDFAASTVSAVPHYSKSEFDIYMKQTKGGSESAIGSKDDPSLGLSLAGLENSDAGIHSQENSAFEEMDDKASPIFSCRSNLCWGVPDDDQRQLTGRLGEEVVYKYLTEKYGSMSVNWVNEKEETGSPFDMILSKVDGKKEYIEVKATRSVRKDWFEITNREWEFASKNSDCFTIIRVFFTRTEPVKLVMLANPIKLYQQKFIKLVVLTPTTHHLALPEVTLMPHGGNGFEP